MTRVAASIADPTPRGIAGEIARQIASGDLAPGDRLPTVRSLAAELGVSPATVSHAWQALAAAGLIYSRGRSGSFVRETSPEWLPPRLRPIAGQPDARLDLSTGTPDPALLPALGPALSRVSERADTSSYLGLPVIGELEQVLRERWPYPVPALTIVDGALDALSRCIELVTGFGSRVIVENPTFPPILDLIDQVGAERVAVDLDAEGIRPESLAEALSLSPAALVLQPRAQNPTGASMTAARAEKLARIIRSARMADKLVVIEDDHSGEISAARDVSLGKWLPDRVLHVRSFSKSHGPDLRIAALGGPVQLIARLVARRLLGPGWTSRMLQSILFDLLTNSDSVSAVADARRVYRARQRAFAAALTDQGLPTRTADGVNTWIPVADERTAIVRLAAEGIRVAAGGAFFAADAGHFVRVTAGRMTSGFEDVAASVVAAARA